MHKGRWRVAASSTVTLARGFGAFLSQAWRRHRLRQGRALGRHLDKPRSWLVTGCGDGGLSEVFRLCLNDFRRERILEQFLSDPRIDPFTAEIRRIEADPRAGRSGGPPLLR